MYKLSNIAKSLNEGGYSRLMQIMSGNVPSVKSMGIITAENPYSKKLSGEENNKLNLSLKKDIDDSNLTYVKIVGKYGNVENPFFIINPDLSDLIRFGRTYRQETFIYGKKIENNKIIFNLYADYNKLGEYEIDAVAGNRYLVYNPAKDMGIYYKQKDPEGKEYISSDTSLSARKSSKKSGTYQSIKNTDKDFLSVYKGRAFKIPFYESENDAIFEGGVLSFDYYMLNEESRKIADEILLFEKMLNEYDDTMVKNINYWSKRGHIKHNLKKINILQEVKSSNSINREIIFKNGYVGLYHYSKIYLGKSAILDPKISFKNRRFHSASDYKVSLVPRIFYYINPDDVEPLVQSNYLYKAKVDGSSILNIAVAFKLFYNNKSELKIENPAVYNIIKKSLNEYGNIDFDKLLKNSRKNFNGIYYETGGIPMVCMFVKTEATLVKNLNK